MTTCYMLLGGFYGQEDPYNTYKDLPTDTYETRFVYD